MIISKKHKFVFVSVNKSATHSMYAMLIEHYSGKHLALLRGGKDSQPYHLNDIPSKFRTYYTFTVVRNPFDRAVSLWQSLTSQTRYAEQYKEFKDNFKQFTRFLVSWRMHYSNTKFGGRTHLVPMNEWLRGIRFDKILKLESLDREFCKLPFVKGAGPTIPRLMVRKRGKTRKWWTLYDDENRQNIIMWAGDDFEKYGYSIYF